MKTLLEHGYGLGAPYLNQLNQLDFDTRRLYILSISSLPLIWADDHHWGGYGHFDSFDALFCNLRNRD